MDFLNEQRGKSANDGLYKIDMKLVKDKKKGWRSVVRFLPNLTKDGKVSQSVIEKQSHYVNIKEPRELSGVFDSPRNFNESCPLTTLYYNMQNSNNAILMEKSKQLQYSKKYYAYVLVLEDEQQPHLQGTIQIYQFGKTIKDKISAEKSGEISGMPCNVFDLTKGKDFVIIAKEIQTGNETYPDYKMSMFKPETTSLPIYDKEKGVFRNIPVGVDGKVEPKIQIKIKDFLLNREHDLEEFAAKRLTDEQQAKINEITQFLTGKVSTSYAKAQGSVTPTTSDFDFKDNFDNNPMHSGNDNITGIIQDEDDFFNS
ncbi:MAG: hypothetical protein M0R46_13255 [Candidatus Muirbacterium halophilum]|nr:hypothetical protein [Candidatus Muirbacterium halophilum]